MKDKNAVVVAVGLAVIVCIVAFVTYANSEFVTLSTQTAEATTRMQLQQKDLIIAKLMQQMRAKQSELIAARADLANIKGAVNTLQASLKDTAAPAVAVTPQGAKK